VIDCIVFSCRLTGDGFLAFYKPACIDRPDDVWNDLTMFNYRYDLRKEEDARKEDEAAANPETMPRWILCSNKEVVMRSCA